MTRASDRVRSGARASGAAAAACGAEAGAAAAYGAEAGAAPDTCAAAPSRGQAPEVVAVDWFCLTSANFSKAARGELQKKNAQGVPGKLYLKSFELGLLFLPELLALPPPRPYSCTPGFYIERLPLAYSLGEAAAPALRERGVPLAALPLPYPLPPPRYRPDEKPYISDQPKELPDMTWLLWDYNP